MFKTVLITILFLNVFTFFSQESKIVRPKEINSSILLVDNSENKNVIENKVTKTYLVKNEEYYLNFINALEIKKEIVSKDSLMNIKAIQENWYIKIDNELKKANAALDLIIKNEK